MVNLTTHSADEHFTYPCTVDLTMQAKSDELVYLIQQDPRPKYKKTRLSGVNILSAVELVLSLRFLIKPAAF